MTDINISEIVVGSSVLSVVNNGNRTDNSSTLYVSYADTTQILSIAYDFNKEIILQGIPLSLSSFNAPDTAINPSTNSAGFGHYYAFNVIKNLNPEDPDSNPSIAPNEPTHPSNLTCTLNGNRISLSKIDERYYLNIFESSDPSVPEDPAYEIIFMGMPMAKTVNGVLLLNLSSYTFADVEELSSVIIGGSPITVGRIGNNYYLIVKELTAITT